MLTQSQRRRYFAGMAWADGWPGSEVSILHISILHTKLFCAVKGICPVALSYVSHN